MASGLKRQHSHDNQQADCKSAVHPFSTTRAPHSHKQSASPGPAARKQHITRCRPPRLQPSNICKHAVYEPNPDHSFCLQLLSLQQLQLCRAHTLVVVESPTKARKIGEILGPTYVVEASYGHVRQLPRKGTAIEPDRDFKMTWEVSKPEKLKHLEAQLAGASGLVLATDPDREGEAISWHLLQHFQVRTGVNHTVMCC